MGRTFRALALQSWRKSRLVRVLKTMLNLAVIAIAGNADDGRLGSPVEQEYQDASRQPMALLFA
jgi:hypothetical protein